MVSLKLTRRKAKCECMKNTIGFGVVSHKQRNKLR